MARASEAGDKPLTVRQLNDELKSVLARSHGDVWVEGEVSRFNLHSSGHWYFNLVDPESKPQNTLAAVMFRGNNQFLGWKPRDGERVICRGGIDVYGPQGKYSLIVRKMDPSGAGARARALEELKRKLAAEGLFSQERKRKLPYLPSAVGVATSPTGAAFQDILRVLGQRFPGMTVYLAPCRVQGEGAAAEIAEAIALLNRHGKSDVLIVGRGGGSIEDLWAFNEEIAVRAVANSRIPVISAVGHEIDTSLCDLAADARAATPSAAAEAAVPVQSDLIHYVAELRDRMAIAARGQVRRRRDTLRKMRLMHPGQKLNLVRQRARDLEKRLLQSARLQVERKSRRMGNAAARLDALSPLRVLKRGYSIATAGGRAITDAETLSPGQSLEIRFARGSASASVVQVSPEPER